MREIRIGENEKTTSKDADMMCGDDGTFDHHSHIVPGAQVENNPAYQKS